MSNSAVDFSDLDDFDTAAVTDKQQPAAATMLDAGAAWGQRMANKLPQQRVKKLGARDVPRDPLKFAPCVKCQGSGRWRRVTYTSGAINRACFKCNGTGNGLSLASTSVRARERAVESKVRAVAGRMADAAAFRAANPDIVRWWSTNQAFAFAASTQAALDKFGYLTDTQLAAIRKCIASQAERDAKRAAERAARVVDVGGDGLAKVLRHFEQARASGLKNPALVFEGLCFKPAKKYPGELYVTSGRAFESEYYGRVNAQGKFDPTRAVTPVTLELVKRIGADPVAEAVAYGKRTGVCCCCGRELTNDGSIEAGIGPVCAERWGM